MSVQKRNNVQVSGIPDATSTIFFAHGFGCDQTMWRRLAPTYAGRYRVVMFDLLGCGQSDVQAFDKTRYATLQGYADDLIEIVEHFGQGRALFVGHSVAAMIGLLAELARPGLFSAHVMVGPSPRYIDDEGYRGGFSQADIDSLLKTLHSNYLGWSSTMAPVLMGSAEQPALGIELAAAFARTDPDIAEHFARLTFNSDHRADLPKLKAPTLIIQCDDDLIAPLAVGRYMHAAILGSTLRVIDNKGHFPHLSQPDASARAIDEFLAALPA